MEEVRFLDEKKAKEAVEKLEKVYPDTKYYLNFSGPLQLLVAAILSAQTRDVVVNKLTPVLFKKYSTVEDFAELKESELIPAIKSVTFAENKAKNIIAACKLIREKYSGKVPDRMDDLLSLPGVGRKTANTILINAYGIVKGIPVDTWVIKLSYRMGLSANKNPDKIEQDLMKVVHKQHWHNFAYVMKTHGKKICQTVPFCSRCPIKSMCPKNGVAKAF